MNDRKQHLVKAAHKKSRDEEIAKYGKQISMYYWKGDKKHHERRNAEWAR